MKKMPGDIIILYMFIMNENHDVWFLRYGADRQNFFSFCPIFCTFIPLATQNEKKHMDIS